MKTVFISSEIRPYAYTGGLADVGGALPAALHQLGVDVVRVMPLYRQVWERDFPKSDTGLRINVPVGLQTKVAEIWQSDEPGPVTYFIRKDEYFDRRELYSLPERDYDDNFERFLFFQKAVVGLMDALKTQADVVHINDWQCGLVPYFLEYGMYGTGRGRTEKIVLTIHNLAYQGIFPDHEFPQSNLPYSCFSVDELEFYGKINCLKGAIVRADHVTTVSRRYAAEIMTGEFGCGLEGVLRQAQFKVSGILNGVDYASWDPMSDPLIAAPYHAGDLSGKADCKRDLLARMGLMGAAVDERIPVVGMVSRLVDQKGLDLLSEAMERIMERDVYLVMLGTGQEKYQDLARRWAARWPGRFGLHIGFDNQLAHQIEAGADLFLMPSRFEPCGLNQLYSLRYGTLPLVHATGGLDDTIQSLSSDGGAGNGFKFEPYTADALLAAFDQALQLYGCKQQWVRAQQRAMAEEYSWARSADEYLALYERLLIHT